MTSHTGRLYSLAIALVVFFLAWAVIATHPWATATKDARLQALAAREAQIRKEAKLVQTVVAQRWANYQAQLKTRKAAIAAAKAASSAQLASVSTASSGTASASSPVKVVTLPPLTVTRTS